MSSDSETRLAAEPGAGVGLEGLLRVPMLVLRGDRKGGDTGKLLRPAELFDRRSDQGGWLGGPRRRDPGMAGHQRRGNDAHQTK